MKQLTAVLAIAFTALTTQAFAGDGVGHHPRKNINAREYHQDQRMKQGIRSGQLTREETRQLQQERRSIRQEERAYRADGSLNKAERKDLHQDLNQMSKDIYNEKHDAEVRPKVNRP